MGLHGSIKIPFLKGKEHLLKQSFICVNEF